MSVTARDLITRLQQFSPDAEIDLSGEWGSSVTLSVGDTAVMENESLIPVVEQQCPHTNTREGDYVDAQGREHDVEWCHGCGEELSNVIVSTQKEQDADNAPAGYGHGEAHAWASGWNAAVASKKEQS